MDSLTTDVEVTRICGQRDQALRLMSEAVGMMCEAHKLASEAHATSKNAASGALFHMRDRRNDDAFSALFRSVDRERSEQVFKAHTDASIWMHILDVTGMKNLMDATARDEFFQQLQANEVPEVNEDNILATLQSLHGDAKEIFQRGLARAFSDLDKRFKSHDAFQLGARIILTRVFDSTGFPSYYSTGWQTLADVERVLAVLDGTTPESGALQAAVQSSRDGTWGPHQSVSETPYLRIRIFKNGNAHLWFKRKDLVKKANLLLAEYYGEVLPDSVPEDVPEVSTALSRDLAYYPTPPAVVELLTRDLYLPPGSTVLEPSAGTGSICHALLAKGCHVDAVEVDPERAGMLRRIKGLSVYCENFLRRPVREGYDAVIMNPPFSGTHWMGHVVHAFAYLLPGGELRAVLPVTAYVAETKAHLEFRAWALERSRYGRIQWRDLPPRSFSSSGTNINTGILTLRR